MSYFANMLMQTEPLEEHERRGLQEWLQALEVDIETFGPAPEDLLRIAAIKARLAKEAP